MTLPEIVSRATWLAARKRLLAKEKELTRLRDALNADRRRLPMVRVDKGYAFTGPDGEAHLPDLFGGARQLVVQHVMFDPAWEDACPSCSASLDELSSSEIEHLRERDTAFAAVSRAPYPKLASYQTRRGWHFLPWYSSAGSDFNYDFHVSLDASVARVEYNYRDADKLRAAGQTSLIEAPTEMHGLSCFLREGDEVFHTYSTYGRGTDIGGAYALLDLTALGRQEDWEEPKGRAGKVYGAVPDFSDGPAPCDC